MSGGAVHLYLHLDALALNDTLTILAIELGFALTQSKQCIRLRDDAEDDADGPGARGIRRQGLDVRVLANAEGIGECQGIKGEVRSVAELAADGGVLQDGVHGLGVGGDGSGLEVLDVLAEAKDLADEAELLLDGIPGGDLGGAAVGTEEVPGVEAGEILEDAHELVAADGGGDEAQVVGHRGVVDEGVGDHGV